MVRANISSGWPPVTGFQRSPCILSDWLIICTCKWLELTQTFSTLCTVIQSLTLFFSYWIYSRLACVAGSPGKGRRGEGRGNWSEPPRLHTCSSSPSPPLLFPREPATQANSRHSAWLTQVEVSGEVTCRLGMLLLMASNVKVLGGEVEQLKEENSMWKILHEQMWVVWVLLKYKVRWCAYDINHIYELWIKNRSESDLRSCEAT